MIKIEEIKDINYDYKHMNLINPFDFKNLLGTKFLKPFVLQFQSFIENNELLYTTTTFEYLKFIDKIYNKSEIECHICKSNSKYYCGFYQDFFCRTCFDSHSQKCENYNHFIKMQSANVIQISNNNNYINDINRIIEKENSKFLINNNPMDWKHCPCNENKNIIYCEHGIRCTNCACHKCNNDYETDNYKFINLDIIFLKYESKLYNEIENLENEVNEFNENIAKLYIENKDKIENETRKKRFIKHFMYLRNNFIAYQKLKIIICNIIKKNQDMNLFKLFTYFKEHKMRFKKFIYLNNLSQDKNIGRISNFFASQNPIYFEEIDDEYNINIVNEYLNLENNEEKSNEINEKKEEKEEKLPDCKLEIKSNEINNIKSYIESNNIFKFYDDDKRNIYFIRFTSDFSYQKMEIFKRENNNDLKVECKILHKLKNGKLFFSLINNNDNKNWICLSETSDDKILDIRMAEWIDKSFKFKEN